ncbi:MAG: hypothetical protein K0M66_11075 [Thiobacillus sp.]|nr:hypothetical protein [Thiobacillus sp.]
MKTSKAEKVVVEYVVDVRSAKSAGRWGGYVRVWAKPVFEDGKMGSGHDPRSITIARSVYGRSSGGPKTDLGRALAFASAQVAAMNATLAAERQNADYVLTGGAE